MDFHRLRYDWAEKTYEKFMDKFDPNIYQHYGMASTKDQVSVVIYGPSQVGKTSFILELLGLDRSKTLIVQDVLRGGRASGNSSTSTVTRYHKSNNDFWHIMLKSEEDLLPAYREYTQLTDEEAKVCLSEIRQDMEQQGRKYKVSEIEIFIPNTYISLDAINKYQQKDIVIRDLPGVNAENVNEQSYVIKSVEDKVNMADIAILMSKIDDLSKLINPKHLELDILQNWWLKPEKFKVVFTGAFSNASIKDFLNQDSASSPQSDLKNLLRRHVISECQRFNQNLNINLSQVFITEVGDSWNTIEYSTTTDYLNIIQPIKTDFFKGLEQEIFSANNPLNRLRGGYQIGKTAAFLLKTKRDQHAYILDDIENKLERLSRSREAQMQYRQDDIANIKIAKQKIELAPKHNQLKGYDFQKKILKIQNESLDELKETDKTVPALKEILSNFSTKMESLWNSQFEEDTPFEETKDVSEIRNILKDYWVESYFFDENYKNDVSKVKKAIESQINQIRTKFDAKLEESLKKQIMDYKKDIKLLEENIKFHEKLIDQYQRDVENLQKQRDAQMQEMLDYERIRNRDIEYGNNFLEFMREGLSDFLEHYSNLAQLEQDPHRKFLYIALQRTIKRDFNKVCDYS